MVFTIAFKLGYESFGLHTPSFYAFARCRISNKMKSNIIMPFIYVNIEKLARICNWMLQSHSLRPFLKLKMFTKWIAVLTELGLMYFGFKSCYELKFLPYYFPLEILTNFNNPQKQKLLFNIDIWIFCIKFFEEIKS